MNAFIFFALSVGGIVAIAYFAYWWNRHGGGKALREQEERRKRERAASAAARGWQYDPTINGDIHYRISGQLEDGRDWQMEYNADQSSSSSSPKLIFRVPSPAERGHAWVIHDRRTWSFMQKGGVRAVASGILKLAGAFSDEMRTRKEFFLNARILPAGSDVFREHFVLVSQDDKWTALVSSSIERQILHWPAFKQSMTNRDNCFSAELTDAGLKVQLFADAPDFAVIEHMVRLGQALAARSADIEQGSAPQP